jgi:hypothetical protein
MSLSGNEIQKDVLTPQTIPLRIRDDDGNIIEGALETMKKWRKLIFEAKGNTKDFWLVSSTGKKYKSKMRYILCSERALKAIIRRGWYYPHSSQRDLINLLKASPERFNVCIVQREMNGKSFVMLHTELKREAA